MKSIFLAIALALATAEAARWPGKVIRNPDPFEVYDMVYPDILIMPAIEEIEEEPYMQHIPLRPNEVVPKPDWNLA